MACPDCAARRRMARDALFNASVAEALGHVVTGAAEAVGLKEKTGVADEAAKAKKPAPAKRKGA